jgi:hypothetical protein
LLAHEAIPRRSLTADAGACARGGVVKRWGALDDYIEAQIHGPVRLGHDIEALVLDPCFRDTEVEALAVALPCPVEWHHGFRLTTSRHSNVSGTMSRALALASRLLIGDHDLSSGGRHTSQVHD